MEICTNDESETRFQKKFVKSDTWEVKYLLEKIRNKKINLPRYQRPRRWYILPEDVPKNYNDVPNEREYIDFLFATQETIEPIQFQRNGDMYSNMNGNNRINAINHFITRPFHLYGEYLDDLKKMIQEETKDEDLCREIIEVIVEIPYHTMLNIHKIWQIKEYFVNQNKGEIYNKFEEIMGKKIELLDKEWDKLENKWLHKGEFNPKISINCFEGFTEQECNKFFQDIHKYAGKISEQNILASILFSCDNFEINNKVLKTELDFYVQNYYKDKGKNEILQCYRFNQKKNKMNAFDFLDSFQMLMSNKYNIINHTHDHKKGQKLFFKLFKILYGVNIADNINTENINDFIEKIEYSCNILSIIQKKIFPEIPIFQDIEWKNKTKTKLSFNKLLILIITIIGFKNNKTDQTVILNHIERVILFDFFIESFKKNEDYKIYSCYNKLNHGKERHTHNSFLCNPEILAINLNKKLFSDCIDKYLKCKLNESQRHRENSNDKKRNKRRKLDFFERILLLYYYKRNVPTYLLDDKFSLEHIAPFSMEWKDKVDHDRLGNIIPIFSEINNFRLNRHIKVYKEKEKGKELFNFFKEILPSEENYNNMLEHQGVSTKSKVILKDNDKYNQFCEKNEEVYKNTFLKDLFN